MNELFSNVPWKSVLIIAILTGTATLSAIVVYTMVEIVARFYRNRATPASQSVTRDLSLVRFYVVWAICNAIVIAIAPSLLFLFEVKDAWAWFGVVVLGLIAYNAISLKTVGPKKRAALILFGRPIADIESGIALVPLLIAYLEPFDKNFVQIELPGPPEKVWQGKTIETIDGKPVVVPTEPPANERDEWFKPIRVVFNDNDPKAEQDPVLEIIDDPTDDKHDPLRQRVIVELGYHYQIQTTKPRLFIQTLGSKKEAIQTISDMSTSELTTLLHKGTAARANSNMEAIARQATLNLMRSLLNMSGKIIPPCPAKLEPDPAALTPPVTESVGERRERYSRFYVDQFNWLNEQLDQYIGMRILKIQMKPLGFGRDLAVKLQSVSEAAATSLATERTAIAEKKRLGQVGEGNALAAASMRRRLAVPGETVLGLETLKGMDKSKMILATGQSPLSEIIKAGLGLKEALANPNPPTT